MKNNSQIILTYESILINIKQLIKNLLQFFSSEDP